MKIRDVLRLLADDGWLLVAQRGSHRLFKHPTKPGRVTVAGHPGDELAPGTLKQRLETGRFEGKEIDMKFLVVFEKSPRNYSAYLPDLPGCVATGKTKARCLANIRAALALHLAGIREDGQRIPAPRAEAKLVTA